MGAEPKIFSMHPIRYNAPWHDLKHVLVGRTYSPEFYEPIGDHRVRDSLQRIARDTEEDYQQLIGTLQSLGVSVSRPPLPGHTTIMDYINPEGQIDYQRSGSFTLIPRPPMQPRDSFLTVGDLLLKTNPESEIMLAGLDPAQVIDPWQAQDQWQLAAGRYFDAPLATVVGDTIILDCRDHDWLAGYFQQALHDYRVRPVYIGGHNDAVYAVIKPGVLISTYHHDNYRDSFPGWTVKYIENQSWNAIPNWRSLKHANVDRYWVPEHLHNPQFQAFIDTWLGEWMGYVQETVFDINVLQIDQTTVLVNNYNKDMFDFLALHGVEAVVVPFRHRFFWDGGLHCITNDLYREGPREDYFA